jgi:hypothetical protein
MKTDPYQFCHEDEPDKKRGMPPGIGAAPGLFTPLIIRQDRRGLIQGYFQGKLIILIHASASSFRPSM